MEIKQMEAEKGKLEAEKNDLMNKSGMLSSPEKQQIKNLVSKIEGREKDDGSVVKLLPNHSIDVNGKQVSLLDVLKGTLKNSVVTDAEKEKIKSLDTQIKALNTLINSK